MSILQRLAALLGILLSSVLLLLALRRARFRRDMRRIWRDLEPTAPASDTFSPDTVAHLPEPVRRYFLRAIAPGTPLAASVDLTMHGQIKLDARWYPFTARQRLTPARGFVWAPRITMGALRVVGADTYADGKGQMRFDLFGLVPLVQSTGADVDRSAVGRLVIESIWLPAALLPQPGVQWSVINDRTIAATLEVGGTSHTLTLTIDAAGQLQSAVLDRWSGEEQRFVPFGCVVHAERTFGGFTIPAQAQVGWWFGTERFEPEGMFFTFSVEQAQYQ